MYALILNLGNRAIRTLVGSFSIIWSTTTFYIYTEGMFVYTYTYICICAHVISQPIHHDTRFSKTGVNACNHRNTAGSSFVCRLERFTSRDRNFVFDRIIYCLRCVYGRRLKHENWTTRARPGQQTVAFDYVISALFAELQSDIKGYCSTLFHVRIYSGNLFYRRVFLVSAPNR